MIGINRLIVKASPCHLFQLSGRCKLSRASIMRAQNCSSLRRSFSRRYPNIPEEFFSQEEIEADQELDRNQLGLEQISEEYLDQDDMVSELLNLARSRGLSPDASQGEEIFNRMKQEEEDGDEAIQDLFRQLGMDEMLGNEDLNPKQVESLMKKIDKFFQNPSGDFTEAMMAMPELTRMTSVTAKKSAGEDLSDDELKYLADSSQYHQEMKSGVDEAEEERRRHSRKYMADPDQEKPQW